MSEILLCLAIIFPAKLVSSDTVARSYDAVRSCNGNVGRKQGSSVLITLRRGGFVDGDGSQSRGPRSGAHDAKTRAVNALALETSVRKLTCGVSSKASNCR